MQKLLQRKLTPEQEAIQFDRQRDIESGIDPGATSKDSKIIKQRKKEQELRDANAKNQRLESVADFDINPIGYLKDQLSQGTFEGADKKFQYLLLTCLVKIQLALESPDLNLLTRK